MMFWHRMTATILFLTLALVAGCSAPSNVISQSITTQSPPSRITTTTPGQETSYKTTGVPTGTSGDLTSNKVSPKVDPTMAMYTLVTEVPAAGGYILISPESDNGRYAVGTIITLIAVADPDHEFNSWGGDASGVERTTTITMDSDKRVTAYFIPM
jgi:hypothetical protein